MNDNTVFGCYVERLGGSWIVRYAGDGSVLCFRPDQESAEDYARQFRSAPSQEPPK